MRRPPRACQRGVFIPREGEREPFSHEAATAEGVRQPAAAIGEAGEVILQAGMSDLCRGGSGHRRIERGWEAGAMMGRRRGLQHRQLYRRPGVGLYTHPMTTPALKSIDITHRPDVLRLVEEVRQTGEARALRRGDEVVAIIRPAAVPTPRPRRTRRPRSTSALLAGYGAVQPRRQPEDFAAAREAFEAGVGEEVAGAGAGTTES